MWEESCPRLEILLLKTICFVFVTENSFSQYGTFTSRGKVETKEKQEIAQPHGLKFF